MIWYHWLIVAVSVVAILFVIFMWAEAQAQKDFERIMNGGKTNAQMLRQVIREAKRKGVN